MKMYGLSTEQMERMREDIAHYQDSQKDVRTVLKDMYCEFFSDKTDDIGYVMADKVLRLVSEYNQDICDAKTDSNAWMERKFQLLLAEKASLVERCNTLYQTRIAVTVSSIYATEGQAAAESYQTEHGNKVFLENEVTEELEQKLKEELKEVIRNNKVLLAAMDAFAQNAECGDDEENVTVALGDDAVKLKAVMTMQAYLQSGEDGYLQNIFPENTSLHDISYSVCASVDAMSTAQAVESGEISPEEGVDTLRIIGIVLGCTIAIWVGAVVGIGIMSLLGTGFLALVGGFIFVGAWGFSSAKLFMNAGVAVVKGVKCVVSFGAKLVVSAGRKLLNGVKKLANSLRSLFSNEAADSSEQEHAYTFPEHDSTECNYENSVIRQPARA